MAEYPDFEKTCGYGSVTGIGGANCRHSWWPFLEGVMERTYTDEELADIDPSPVEYEGRTYSAYEATQKQRQLERSIRRCKREKTAYQAAGLEEEATAANIHLRRLRGKYRAFSKAAGLPEQPERMRVLNAAKTPAAAEGDIGDLIRRAGKSMIRMQKVTGFNGLPKELQRSFHDGIARTTPEMRAVLQKVYRNADYIVGSGKRSYFHPGTGLNIILVGRNADASTLAHELFHKLDAKNRISPRFTRSLKKDYSTLNALSGGNIQQYLRRNYPDAFVSDRVTGQMKFKEEYRGVSDILNGMSGGEIRLGYGHRKKYWEDPGALESEAWAQFGRVQFSNRPEVLKMFKELFPKFSDSAIMALKGLI